MSSLNKMICIGNLGKDPEIRSFPNGDRVVNISIATKETWRDKTTGERKESTEWHRVVFNGKLAEIAGEYLKKGSQVYVEGPLKTRTWTDKDGIEKFVVEIRATTLTMLGSKTAAGNDGGGNGEGYGSGGGYSTPAPQARQPENKRPAAPQPPRKSAFDDMDDDIPFVTSSMYFDMTPSKKRRMDRYDF